MCALSQNDCFRKSSHPSRAVLRARCLQINHSVEARAACRQQTPELHKSAPVGLKSQVSPLEVTDANDSLVSIPPPTFSSALLLFWPNLPGHAVRFQRAEIKGAGGQSQKGPKSMTLMFAEALGLLIKPTEGSFLVFFTLLCNYLRWLAALQRAHFPALPVSSLPYCF